MYQWISKIILFVFEFKIPSLHQANSFHPFRVDKWAVSCNQMVAITSQWWRRLVNAYEVKAGMVCLQCKNCVIHTWALQRWASYDWALYKCLSSFFFTLSVAVQKLPILFVHIWLKVLLKLCNHRLNELAWLILCRYHLVDSQLTYGITTLTPIINSTICICNTVEWNCTFYNFVAINCWKQIWSFMWVV